MNKEILERINQIDKELKELEDMEIAGLPGTGRFSLKNIIENNIKKEEENDMNIEEIIDEKVNDFLEEIEDIDFKIFDEYLKITNNDNSYILTLLDERVTNDFKMLAIRTLIRVYVWKLYHDDNIRISKNELMNLAIMGMTTCEIAPEDRFLQSMIYGLCESMKGGE